MKIALSLGILLFSFLLLTGCTETAPTEAPIVQPTVVPAEPAPVGDSPDISSELASIDAAFAAGMSKVNGEFDAFDLEYNINNWFYGVITDSLLAGMNRNKLAISDAMAALSVKETEYNALMATADASGFSSEETALVAGIDGKISQANGKDAEITKCIEEMENYREFMRLLQENVILGDRLDSENMLINTYLDGEQYSKALDQVTKIQKTLADMKVNIAARDALGIQGPLGTSLEAADLMHDAYGIYKEYIVALEDGRTYTIESKWSEFNAKLSEAVAVEDPNISSDTYQINEIDRWYSQNVGACVGVFQE